MKLSSDAGSEFMNTESTINNAENQAVASWINYLNKLRIENYLDKISGQNVNLKLALTELEELKKSIANEVVKTNRGGEKGMHGFIGERMQVSVANAKELVKGMPKIYKLIDDNGRDDYLRNQIPIQQKCVQGNYGLNAIEEHLEKYPSFLDDGGIYQIPKDYYQKIRYISSMSEKEAGKLGNVDWHLWKKIQLFTQKTGIRIEDIEPMEVGYADIQKGTYEKTIKIEEGKIKAEDRKIRKEAYEQKKPSLQEGRKVTVVAAGVEGGLAFAMAVSKKHKDGTRIVDYTADDWKEVGIDTGKGVIKGGIRGSAVYALTNFTRTPANVASGLVTAAFGTLSNAVKYSNGELTQEEFIANSEACCLDVAISTVSAAMGEVIIPIPVLGAVIGTAVGNYMYDLAKEYCDINVLDSIEHYYAQMKQTNAEYKVFVEKMESEFKKYSSALELALDEDVNIAFDNSIALARYVGVDEEKILKTKADIDNYFLS